MCSMRRDGTANHPTTSDNAIRFVWCHPIKKRSVGGRLLWSGVMCMCMCKCMCADVRCLIGFSKQYLTFSLDFDRRCSFTMRFQLAQPFDNWVARALGPWWFAHSEGSGRGWPRTTTKTRVRKASVSSISAEILLHMLRGTRHAPDYLLDAPIRHFR
jgi:hypothetical protein